MPQVERLWFLDTSVTVLVSSEDEAHGITILEHEAPSGDSPPLHVHRREDETFHVIRGELKLVIDGREAVAASGRTVRVPMGAAHTYRVISEGGARFLTITGGRDFERLVRKLGRIPEGPGLPPPSGPPTEAAIADLVRHCNEHGIDVVGPPLT